MLGNQSNVVCVWSLGIKVGVQEKNANYEGGKKKVIQTKVKALLG